MIFNTKTITLKDGRTAILRAPRPEAIMLRDGSLRNEYLMRLVL